MIVELIGKIVIITLGIASVVGMLLMLAGACEIIADEFRETREEDFTDPSHNSDNEDNHVKNKQLWKEQVTTKKESKSTATRKRNENGNRRSTRSLCVSRTPHQK